MFDPISYNEIDEFKKRFTKRSNNLFSGNYLKGKMLTWHESLGGPPEPRYVTRTNYAHYDGRLAVVPIEPNKEYTIKVHEPDKKNNFRVAVCNDFPLFPDYWTLESEVDTFFIDDPSLNEYTFTNTATGRWLLVYVSNASKEPLLQVEEGPTATEYAPFVVLKYDMIEKPLIGAGSATIGKDRFIRAMNEKASQIGMTNTHFVEPAGYPSTIEQTMSALDMVRSGIHAIAYREICEVWNKKTYTFHIEGPNARDITVNTTVTNPTLENAYHIFGGKTGSIGGSSAISGYHCLAVVGVPGEDKWLIGAVRKASNATSRFTELKKAFDNAVAKLADPQATVTEVEAEGAAVCLVPPYNPASYQQYDLPLLYEKNANMPGHVASVTKIITAIVLLDHIKDLAKKIEIQSEDIKSGTGPVFLEGDIFTLRDALHCLLLPSSNTCAHAIARVVGNKIINAR